MAPRNPRTELATHDVTNQPPPLEDINLYTADAILQSCCAWSGAARHDVRLSEFGERTGSQEAREWGADANRNAPQFQPFDRYGQRIDEIAFHPAYHNLMTMGLEAGVSGAAWTADAAGHALHAALMVLMGQADYGVCCPMSMTYAAVPALRSETALAARWIPLATMPAYDPRVVPWTEKRAVTIGMAMTEKQGGSDIRANTTHAHPERDGTYRLVGHKWFCSAPMSDAFLTLAQAPGGLTCFLAPRWLDDGTRNPIEIQRLKDKLGDRSNASSEIEYRDASAWRVGDEGRGVRTIIEMVQFTRFDCVVGSATQMRHAAALALWHVQGRSAFQRRLIDQPLMRAVLADLALDIEGAFALAFRLAMALDRGDDPHEAALARIGLPLAKYLVTKRAPAVIAEAMECLGGAGYVEEAPLARIFRQSPVNAIWEGSGNVIALDVIRALSRDPHCAAALVTELANAGLAARAGIDVPAILAQPISEREARHAVEQLAMALTAAVLVRFGQPAAADGFLVRRMAGRSLTLGAGSGTIDESALIERLALSA